MECYVLTVKNYGKLHEGSNEGVDWILPQFRAIKDTSAAFTINKMLQYCSGKWGIIKSINALGTSIHHGSAYDMAFNSTLDVLSAIPSGGWNFRGQNHIMIYLKVSKHCLYARNGFQGAHDVTEIIHPNRTSAFLIFKNAKY